MTELTIDEMRAQTEVKLNQLCNALRGVIQAKDDQIARLEDKILMLQAEAYQLRANKDLEGKK